MQTYEEDIKNAIAILKKGGVLLYPTDTIWGLGCDATDKGAVKRLYELKNRPIGKSMISLIDSFESLEKIVGRIPNTVRTLMETSDRPITVIFDHAKGICDELKAEDGSAAFRIPQFEFVRDICKLLGKPLVSTSANFSSSPAPACYGDIQQELKEKVDYVCQTGQDKRNLSPSKIVRVFENKTIQIIRE